MNALQMLAAQPWVEPLGRTLIHFLWQGLLIAVVYAAVRRSIVPASNVNARYMLACAALAVMMAAPLATWGLMQPQDANRSADYRIRRAPPAVSASDIATVKALPAGVGTTVSSVQPGELLLGVVIVWLAGAVVFWVRLAGGWVLAARMRSTLVRPAPPEWQETVKQLGRRIGLSRPVRLLVSALVQVPAVVGWLSPVVLVPVGALGGLPAAHMEALLLHELAHIRRHDFLINLLQSIAEALLFYHPAVWWVSGHIRSERELCCDDVVVSVSADALTYARALAELESYRPAHLNAAIAANGGSLSNRIARLLGHSQPAVRTGPGPGVLAVTILLLGAAYGLFGQSDLHPAFQVASIKRNPLVTSDPTHHPMYVHPERGGRLTAHNAPLILLIQRAYGVQAFQVVGGPAWMNTDGYDVEAKPKGQTDRKRMWLMAQTLLADRFKLAVHRETRELPVYHLTPAEKGLKLPVPKKVSCISYPPDAPTPPPPSEHGQADCGYVSGPFSSSSKLLRLNGVKVHMADLVRNLALVLGRPVLDKTGFTGDFDLNLSFTADDATMGLPGYGGPGDPGGNRLPTDANLPNIFAALEGQLGLKLVPAKGPVDVLAIDHVDRPISN